MKKVRSSGGPVPTPALSFNTGRACDGFTLIEVIVAVAIFSVISLTVYTTVEQYFLTRQALNKRLVTYKELNRFITLLEKDLRYAIDRPVRGEYGDVEGAVIFPDDPNAGEGMLISVTTALPSYEVAGSSTLTRVVWSLDGKSVVRGTWPVLDRAQDTGIRVFRLLNDVDQLTLEPVLDTEETVFNGADTLADPASNNAGLVKMELVLADGSLYSKVLELDGDY